MIIHALWDYSLMFLSFWETNPWLQRTENIMPTCLWTETGPGIKWKVRFSLEKNSKRTSVKNSNKKIIGHEIGIWLNFGMRSLYNRIPLALWTFNHVRGIIRPLLLLKNILQNFEWENFNFNLSIIDHAHIYLLNCRSPLKRARVVFNVDSD